MGIFESYEEDSRRAIYYAKSAAEWAKAKSITPEHLLIGASIQILKHPAELGPLDFATVWPRLRSLLKLPDNMQLRPCDNSIQTPLDRAGKKVVREARNIALERGESGVRVFHFLCALLRVRSKASKALEKSGITLERLTVLVPAPGIDPLKVAAGEPATPRPSREEPYISLTVLLLIVFAFLGGLALIWWLIR